MQLIARFRLGDTLLGVACIGALCFLNGCGGGSHDSDTAKSGGMVLSFSKGKLETRGLVRLSDLNAVGSKIPVRVLEEYDTGETSPNDAKTDQNGQFGVTVDKTYTDTVDNTSTVVGYDSDGNPVYGTSDSTTYNITEYKYYVPDRCSSTVVANFVGGRPVYSIPGAGTDDDKHHISALMQQAATVAQNSFPNQPVVVVSDDVDACVNHKS